MNLDAIRDMLGGGSFAAVSDAMELAQIGKQPNLRLPAAYVVPDTESANDAASGSYVFEQLLLSTFAVVLLVGADKARKGLAADRICILEDEVISRLHGQQPSGFDSPLGLVDISTADITASYVVRVIRFRARRRIRTVRNP